MTLSEALAERIHSFAEADLSDDARHWAKIGILDTVGVTLAGAREPMVDILRDIPGIADAAGPCLVLGTPARMSALDAVLLNGVAAHAHDFDDFSATIGGHPSIMLSPLIQAIADMQAADATSSDCVSGHDAIVAFNVGFETMMRFARGVNFHHYNKGWHPTVTVGIFGSVAAGARLLDLDRQQTAMALGQVASLASGFKANFGSMVKPLHVGHALRNALFALFGAQRGFLSRPDALDADQGFLDVFNGEGNYRIDDILDGWGEPLDIIDEGLGLKQFPCCGSTHAMINCALDIREKHAPQLDQITDIEVLTHPLRIPHTDTPDPQTLVQAKFSTQYVVCRALTDGAVRMSHFEGRRPWDEPVRDLMQRVRYSAHPDLPAESRHSYAGEVRVTLSDGTKLVEARPHAVGRGLHNPMSEAELFDKYSDCASSVLSTDVAERSFAKLLALEAEQDISVINDILAEGCVGEFKRQA